MLNPSDHETDAILKKHVGEIMDTIQVWVDNVVQKNQHRRDEQSMPSADAKPSCKGNQENRDKWIRIGKQSCSSC